MDTLHDVQVADAPQIPGLLFRTFRGPSDFAGMASLRERAGAWDQVDPFSARETIPTLDDVARIYAEESVGSPNMLCAEVDGSLVGYNQLVWWTEQGGIWVYLHLGWLLPEWRGKGIGGAMLRWAERRLRAVAAEHPTNDNAVLATNASTTEQEATALVRAHGYTLTHYLSDMALRPLRRLPETPLPAGVELRLAIPEHYPAIYRAWKDTWSGLALTTTESADDYSEFVDENVHVAGFDPSLWQVAWSGADVAGFVFCRIRRGVGIVPEVAVRPAWRRRGIARGLLVRGLNALADRGISEVRIVTNAEDEQGARSLYESVGFRELKRHGLYRKPMY